MSFAGACIGNKLIARRAEARARTVSPNTKYPRASSALPAASRGNDFALAHQPDTSSAHPAMCVPAIDVYPRESRMSALRDARQHANRRGVAGDCAVDRMAGGELRARMVVIATSDLITDRITGAYRSAVDGHRRCY